MNVLPFVACVRVCLAAGVMWRKDRERYERLVRQQVKDSLFGSSSVDE